MTLVLATMSVITHLNAYPLPNTDRTSRWWFGSSAAQLAQAEQITSMHRRSLTGCYFYYGFSISQNGTFHAPDAGLVRHSLAPFRSLGLTVSVALATDQGAVESGAALRGVAAAASTAASANLTSLMIDYEPRTNITTAHAQAYAALVAALAQALHARGLSLEICVSSWSILTQFGLYAATGVDGMMSMASTYVGTNTSRNEEWVTMERAAGVSLAQLRVGIGSSNSIYSKWQYNWTSSRLHHFLSWIEAEGVRHVDVWRTDIDAVNATNGTAVWLYDAMAAFLGQPRAEAPPAEAPPAVAQTATQPHIVYMLSDNIGYGGIGFLRARSPAGYSPEVSTPTLDRLAADGVVLARLYTFEFCSPSRSSLLSGRLPGHVNMHNDDQTRPGAGIPAEMTTMPAKLRQVGYRTHHLGKWHIGFATPKHTPLGRGFHSSLGYIAGVSGPDSNTRRTDWVGTGRDSGRRVSRDWVGRARSQPNAVLDQRCPGVQWLPARLVFGRVLWNPSRTGGRCVRRLPWRRLVSC